MKICVIFFACKRSDSDFSFLQSDPLRYTQNHEFIYKFTNEESGREELDEICCSGDNDYYWPILSGTSNVSDLDSLKYLESKNVRILGPSSKFWSMTKLDMERLMSAAGIKTSAVTGGNYDVEGKELSIIVLETRNGVIGLTPLSLTRQRGEMSVKTSDEDSALLNEIKEYGVKAYEALGVLGSGYARVNFRVTLNNDIYVLEIHPIPGFFAKPENLSGDDFVNEINFPGGRESFVNAIIGAKRRIDFIITDYDETSSVYDDLYKQDKHTEPIPPFINQFEFGGNVLDLGCGSGSIGGLILDKHPRVKITGYDISPKMAQLALAKGYTTIKIGLAENLMMEVSDSDTFDHIISFSMLLFVDSNNYIKILSRMFSLAKCSVSFTIDAVTEEYNEKLTKAGFGEMFSYNHLNAFKKFKVPPKWELVHREWVFLWHSPSTKIDIYGLLIRFEKSNSNDDVKAQTGHSHF